jgi:hypothetical protein
MRQTIVLLLYLDDVGSSNNCVNVWFMVVLSLMLCMFDVPCVMGKPCEVRDICIGWWTCWSTSNAGSGVTLLLVVCSLAILSIILRIL